MGGWTKTSDSCWRDDQGNSWTKTSDSCWTRSDGVNITKTNDSHWEWGGTSNNNTDDNWFPEMDDDEE